MTKGGESESMMDTRVWIWKRPSLFGARVCGLVVVGCGVQGFVGMAALQSISSDYTYTYRRMHVYTHACIRICKCVHTLSWPRGRSPKFWRSPRPSPLRVCGCLGRCVIPSGQSIDYVGARVCPVGNGPTQGGGATHTRHVYTLKTHPRPPRCRCGRAGRTPAPWPGT